MEIKNKFNFKHYISKTMLKFYRNEIFLENKIY